MTFPRVFSCEPSRPDSHRRLEATSTSSQAAPKSQPPRTSLAQCSPTYTRETHHQGQQTRRPEREDQDGSQRLRPPDQVDDHAEEHHLEQGGDARKAVGL